MTPKSLQDLREQRAAKAKEAHNLLDASVTAYTKDVEAKVDGLYAEIDQLDGQITRVERAIAESAKGLEPAARVAADQNGRSVDENAHRIGAARGAFNKMLRYGVDALSPEERGFLCPADAGGNAIQNVAVGTNTAGGYLVPTEVQTPVLQKLKAFGGVRSAARSISTTGGNPLAWATMDETAATGEIVAEGVTASASDLTFGQVSIGAYKFSSKIVPVSFEALQDAAVDVESLVIDALATRIARSQNTYFTTGTGSNQPQGVLTAAALGVTLAAGNTTSITYDGLVDLLHSLDPAYRESPSCRFMFNDSTFKAIKKLKDGQNRPLWLPETDAAFAGDSGFGSLFGKPIVINQDMPSFAASAKPVLFGDFSKYLIRDVMATQVFRFTDSAYLSKGQIGFLAWARADGKLIDASNESIRYLANSAT